VQQETSPAVAKQVADFISRMKDCLEVKMPFNVVCEQHQQQEKIKLHF